MKKVCLLFIVVFFLAQAVCFAGDYQRTKIYHLFNLIADGDDWAVVPYSLIGTFTQAVTGIGIAETGRYEVRLKVKHNGKVVEKSSDMYRFEPGYYGIGLEWFPQAAGRYSYHADLFRDGVLIHSVKSLVDVYPEDEEP